MERASTLIVCEDGQKLQRSSLEDLQRVLPVLVRRYHSVRVEKDKLLQAFQALSKEAKRMPGGSGRDTHAQEMYQARWAPIAHRHCHGPCDRDRLHACRAEDGGGEAGEGPAGSERLHPDSAKPADEGRELQDHHQGTSPPCAELCPTRAVSLTMPSVRACRSL